MKREVLCAAFILLTCNFAFGQHYKVLYSFGATGVQDANSPRGKLVFDPAGNLYGTSAFGGESDGGTVFELSQQEDGQWTETILHSFADNTGPTAGLIMDDAGNLYGTTQTGGLQWGTVFEMSPPMFPGLGWTEQVIYVFGGNNTQDGCYPDGKLVFGPDGKLYGTASQCSGPPYGAGSVFQLTPGNGTWSEKIIYRFCADGHHCSDGAYPKAEVTFDKFGNLYGTTQIGGDRSNDGVLYMLSPNPDGTWSETVIQKFALRVGNNPLSAVNIDPLGRLYGTLSSGGGSDNKCGGIQYCGGVFQFTNTPGGWKGTIFQFIGYNGGNPAAGVFIDPANRNLYGTTQFGGDQGSGTVFKIHGRWETVLYHFCSQPSCADGSEPVSALISDLSGNLYGTTSKGGAYGQGVVFEITP